MQIKLIVVLVAGSSICASFTLPADQKVIGQKKDKFDIVRQALKKDGIISEVIDDFTPKCFVTPYYGKKEKAVAFGNKFKKSETKERPSVKIYCPDVHVTPGLTVALTDPDAPSRDDQKWSEMCHWISPLALPDPKSHIDFTVPNDSDEGDLVDYKPPGPPPKTGYHRYVFVLLEGNTTDLVPPENRQHWGMGEPGHGVRDWAKKERLQVIGANYFIEKNKKQ